MLNRLCFVFIIIIYYSVCKIKFLSSATFVIKTKLNYLESHSEFRKSGLLQPWDHLLRQTLRRVTSHVLPICSTSPRFNVPLFTRRRCVVVSRYQKHFAVSNPSQLINNQTHCVQNFLRSSFSLGIVRQLFF